MQVLFEYLYNSFWMYNEKVFMSLDSEFEMKYYWYWLMNYSSVDKEYKFDIENASDDEMSNMMKMLNEEVNYDKFEKLQVEENLTPMKNYDEMTKVYYEDFNFYMNMVYVVTYMMTFMWFMMFYIFKLDLLSEWMLKMLLMMFMMENMYMFYHKIVKCLDMLYLRMYLSFLVIYNSKVIENQKMKKECQKYYYKNMKYMMKYMMMSYKEIMEMNKKEKWYKKMNMIKNLKYMMKDYKMYNYYDNAYNYEMSGSYFMLMSGLMMWLMYLLNMLMMLYMLDWDMMLYLQYNSLFWLSKLCLWTLNMYEKVLKYKFSNVDYMLYNFMEFPMMQMMILIMLLLWKVSFDKINKFIYYCIDFDFLSMESDAWKNKDSEDEENDDDKNMMMMANGSMMSGKK